MKITTQFRLVFMGAGGVGKTSLVERFLYDTFPRVYSPTVEDFHRHLVQLPDGTFKAIEVLDTAGHYQFPAMRALHIKCGTAFALVYAIDDAESFRNVLRLADLIKSQKGSKVPIVIVGNKMDQTSTRDVSEYQGYEAALAKSAGFLETSAILGTNVQDVFMGLLIKTLIPQSAKSMAKRNGRKVASIMERKRSSVTSDFMLENGKRGVCRRQSLSSSSSSSHSLSDVSSCSSDDTERNDSLKMSKNKRRLVKIFRLLDTLF